MIYRPSDHEALILFGERDVEIIGPQEKLIYAKHELDEAREAVEAGLGHAACGDIDYFEAHRGKGHDVTQAFARFDVNPNSSSVGRWQTLLTHIDNIIE